TAGLRLLLDTTANSVDVDARRLSVVNPGGRESRLPYDELVIATGATPVRPPIGGLDTLGPDDGVFLLHTMGDTFALTEFIDTHHPATAIIVGAGYLGLEMAEALTTRGMRVTEVEKNTPNVAHDNPTDQRLHASLILGFADTPARAAFFDSEEITTPSDRLSVFASAVHAYEMSEALTYVKEGKILPHYQT
ncbi:MAG TPA: FAD-dependent oxidoreductase, partial [Jiangellaceae bacterium]|nr:FAD-dependent oxidoreductase [Jiangellaceae bacterium]